MIELGAAARPSCVIGAIGALVWASILDKSACSNWVGLFSFFFFSMCRFFEEAQISGPLRWPLLGQCVFSAERV